MTGSTIGVAVVGTGFGQKIHIPGLQIHHRTEVVAVHHRHLEKAQAIAAAHQIPTACHTLEDILALPQVDAVSISTPPFLHYEMGRKVLEAKKHLLLEKPTALSTAEAIALHQLAEANGGVVTMDFEFRVVPAWMRLAELLADGFVGQPRLIKVDWLVSGRGDPSRAWNWYARKDMGGGALGSMGSHTFDYLRWLIGPIQRLCARLSTSIPTRPDPVTGEAKPVDADDTCSLMLEWADGTLGQVVLSSVTFQGRGHWVEIYGDRGTLILGSDHQKDYVHGFRLWSCRPGQPLVEEPIPDRLAFPKTYDDGRLAPFLRVVDQWVQGIDQGRSLTPSLVDGIYSQQLMDLTHQSHQIGGWVEVPDFDPSLAAQMAQPHP